MLVNFMPNTSLFSFNHLFYDKNNTFYLLLGIIKKENSNLYNDLINSLTNKKENNDLYNLIYSIGNLNGLGIYNSDSIVRSAVSLTVALSDIVFVLPELFSIGVSIFYGYALGKNDKQLALSVWRNGFYGTLTLTFVGVIIIYILIPFVTPAQSVINNISNRDIDNNINELNQILTSKSYSLNNSISNSNGAFNEKIAYLNLNNNISYYLEIGNNHFLKLSNEDVSLLSLNSTDLNKYIVTLSSNELNNLQFINLNSNDILTNWNHYFAITRNYSISWAENFLYIINTGLIVLCLTSLFGTILRADGILHITTAIVITAVILNIILDYVLIVYAQIGMDGAAVASIFGWTFQIIVFIILMHYLRTPHYLNRLSNKQLSVTVHWTDLKITKENIHNFIDFKLIWKLILNGAAVFIGSIMFMVSDILLTNQITYVATKLLGNIGGEYYLSILGAVLPIINLFIAAILGMLQYTSPIFSINYSAKNYRRFQNSFWWATFYATFTMLILYGIICFIPQCTNGILKWFNITNQSANNELESSVKLIRIWFLQVIAFAIALGNYLVFLPSNRVGLAACFNSSRGIIIIIVLYIFSSVAINKSSLLNASLTTSEITDPYTNNAMWFFMWNAAVSNLISGIIMFIFAIWFIYKDVINEKRKLSAIFPFRLFTKNKNEKTMV